MAVTEEQKERKNEMRRLNRARKKEVISKQEPNEEPQEPKEEPKEEPQEEPQEPQEDPEVIRKRAIADKRRASLALARSKIKSKSQITKEKDVELTKIKEENLQLKELANKKEKVPEIVKKPVKVCNTPIRQRPKKQEVYQESQQVQQQPSIDYLTTQSYAEQLQKRLRDSMLQRMMQDTFM